MALSSVVLPEPVPPETSTFRRAAAAMESSLATPTRHGAVCDHRRQMQPLVGKFADRDAGAIDRQWGQDGVDAAAVGKPRIDHRARLSMRRPTARGNLLCNHRDVSGIPELDVDALKLPSRST